MAGLEPVVVFWTGWGLHFVVMLSFTLQVTLLLLSDIRRRNDWAVLKVIIWSAYMLADTTAIYALGHMSVVYRWSPEHHGQLMALWAPLLLVHLGGQDNISAYAIEDNRLWLRHLQTFMLQVAAAVYVLYLSSILSLPMTSKVSWAAILMLVVGVVKYGERIWALKRSNSCASSSLFATSYYNKQVSLVSRTADIDSNLKRATKSWNEELIVAYSLLDVPKQMFEGPTSYVQLDEKVFNEQDYMLGVVGMQLSMMYDLLYTKAAMVHTWYGFCSRLLISLPFTVTALLALHLHGWSLSQDDDKDVAAAAGPYYYKSRSIDVQVTSVLLVGAVVLETISVLRVIFSKWTAVLLYGKGWIITGNVVFSVIAVITGALERLVRIGSYCSSRMWRQYLFKLRQCMQQHDGNDTSKKRSSQKKRDGNNNSRDGIKTMLVEDLLDWDPNVHSYSWLVLGRMGQHSLFKLPYHKDYYNIGRMMAKRIEVEDWWDSNVYSWSTEVPKLVIKKVLELVSSTTTDDIAKSQGQNAVQSHMKHDKQLADWIWMEVGRLKLEERILVWHIATLVYREWWYDQQLRSAMLNHHDAGAELELLQAAVVIANYMFFLLAARPYMVPYPVSRQAYVQLCFDVTHLRYCTEPRLLGAILHQKEALIKGTTPLQPELFLIEPERNNTGTTDGAQPQPSMNSILDRGCQLAAKLIHITLTAEEREALIRQGPSRGKKPRQIRVDGTDQEKADITEQARSSVTSKAVLNMLLQVWVEMLCHTAYLCNEKSHAKHLTDGGEIMTIITLLMIYMKKDTSTSGGTTAAPSSSQGAGATDSQTQIHTHTSVDTVV